MTSDAVTQDTPGNAAALLADALNLNQTMRWLLPDPAEQRHRQRPFFLVLVEHILQQQVLQQGELQLQFDGEALTGAALWFKVAASGEVPRPAIGLIEEALGPAAFARFRKLDEQLRWHHPPDVRHAYLRVIGVAPAQQGNGIGTRMLEAKLTQYDDTGTPVYLEASDKGNCSWYEQHGFQLRGDRFPLPAGPYVYPMWRQPQRQPENSGHW